MGHGNLATIWTIHSRRGEVSWLERNDPAGVPSRQYEVRRLFGGHNAAAGSCFRLSALTDTGQVELRATIEEYDPAELGVVQPYLLAVENPDEPVQPLLLSLSWTNSLPHKFRLPISQPGTVGADAFNFASRTVGPIDFRSGSSQHPH